MKINMKPYLLVIILTLSAPTIYATETDYGTTCLAQVGFSEARGEGSIGMIAVMQVVLNRTKDSHWPKSICEVANQSGQFVGLEKWAYPRFIPHSETKSWNEAITLAELLIGNVKHAPEACRKATYFNQSSSSESLERVCRVGKHVFYIEARKD